MADGTKHATIYRHERESGGRRGYCEECWYCPSKGTCLADLYESDACDNGRRAFYTLERAERAVMGGQG